MLSHIACLGFYMQEMVLSQLMYSIVIYSIVLRRYLLLFLNAGCD